MSLKAKIADVFNEPACDKNRQKDDGARRKGCSKPLTPGAAVGMSGWFYTNVRNNGIVDVAWSFTFTPLVLVYAWAGGGDPARTWLLVLMVLAWSLRLTIYLYRRVMALHGGRMLYLHGQTDQRAGGDGCLLRAR